VNSADTLSTDLMNVQPCKEKCLKLACFWTLHDTGTLVRHMLWVTLLDDGEWSGSCL